MSDTLFGKFKWVKPVSNNKIKKNTISKKDKNAKTDTLIAHPEFNNNNTKTNTKKKVRNRNGCFCCRKRRIKCDGSKPACKNCLRSSYVCVWPDGDESLPHDSDFQIIKFGEPHRKRRKPIKFNNIIKQDDSTSTLSTSVIADVNNSSSPFEFFEPANTNYDKVQVTNNSLVKCKHNSSEFIEDALFRNFVIEINSSVLSKLTPLVSTFPWASFKESNIYDAFVSGFMTDVSPQLTHFKLQPASAFLPSIVDNPIAQNLFFAAGAAFLYSSTHKNEMKILSQEKFIESARQLNTFITINNISGNENWIIIYLLISYLKMRFVSDGRKAETLAMISIVEVIKVWIVNKQKELTKFVKTGDAKIEELDEAVENLLPNSVEVNDIFNSNIFESDEKTSITKIYHDLTRTLQKARKNEKISSFIVQKEQALLLDPISVENEMFVAFASTENRYITAPQILSYERTMIESFIFNYSNLLFVCDKTLVSQMTSPFVMFDLLRPYLSVPIYRCAVPWMNHPVVGAALPIVELQAKVCWLGLFYPLSGNHRTMMNKMRSVAHFYTRPILPPEVKIKEPENVQKKLLESCYASDFVSKAVFIYSTKLLYPDIDYSSDIIQDAVEQAYEDLFNISAQSQIHMILAFAFAVIGSVAINPKHRSYLTWKLKRLREVFSITTFDSILKFYELAWSTVDGKELGWNVLLDDEALQHLVV